MNKKVFLLLTFTFCMMIPQLSFAFSDVEGHWAEEAIQRANTIGIINGYEDNSFQPDHDMTRAELVTVMVKLLGLTTETDKYIPDTTSKDWYYSNMKKAIYFGIIQGDEHGNVNPNSNVTREEAIVMMARAFQLKIEEPFVNEKFEDDSTISEWARKEIMTFVKKQYIKGYEDHTIQPHKNITRAEIVTLLQRVMKNVIMTTYTPKINGNTLIKDRNISLNHVEIYGDLVIGEVAAPSFRFTDVVVVGNLVLYAPLDLTQESIAVNGDIIKAYENSAISSWYYTNENYGITFSIPDGAHSYTDEEDSMIDYSQKDLIVVDVIKNDEYYLQSITNISKDELKKIRTDSIFIRKTGGEVQKYPYEVYMDNASTQLLIIKRDNIVYMIWLYNVVSDNMIDNVLSNITFTAGKEVPNHEKVIYRNAKLALKFTYKNGYVGVDDSYNTGNVYTGESLFKLFIQVNNITDIDQYSLDEVKSLLKSLMKSDGRVVKEEVKELNHHDAIQFEIVSENDKTISLYVIIGHNVYNFIFKGETEAMDAIGTDMFHSIVNSMEF